MVKKIAAVFFCALLFYALGAYSTYRYFAPDVVASTCLNSVANALAYKKSNKDDSVLLALLGEGDSQVLWIDKYCGVFCPQKRYKSWLIRSYADLREHYLREAMANEDMEESLRSSFELFTSDDEYREELEEIFNRYKRDAASEAGAAEGSKRSLDKRSAAD